jgi:hypothetical protein
LVPPRPSGISEYPSLVGAEVSAAAASRTNPHEIKTLLRVVLFVTFAPLSSRVKYKPHRIAAQVFTDASYYDALVVSKAVFLGF